MGIRILVVIDRRTGDVWRLDADSREAEQQIANATRYYGESVAALRARLDAGEELKTAGFVRRLAEPTTEELHRLTQARLNAAEA